MSAVFVSNNAYWLWESCVPKEICKKFIEDHFDVEQVLDGEYHDGVKMVTGDKRKTKICWAHQETFLGAKILSYILMANQKANWYFDIDGTENIQLGRYSIDGHYDWHTDGAIHQKDSTGTQRKLSVSLFLSDPADYDGGDFLFRGSDMPITRAQGSILVFPSLIEHTVTPVTRGERYSAVTWARGPNFR